MDIQQRIKERRKACKLTQLDEANGQARRNPEMEDDREPFEDIPELGWETAYGRG